MKHDRTTVIASAIVVVTGILWGFYWVPVRGLDAAGLTGPWGTLAITLAALLVLLPAMARHWRRLLRAGWGPVVYIALGGAGFALYSIGLVYGRVAIIILLFYLTPVWSTLIGRYVMGWPTTRVRIAAIGIGLAGLGVMLSADGELPIPRGVGEWLALVSGLMWAVATTGIKALEDVEPLDSAFVFALGAALASALLAPMLTPWPTALATASLVQILWLTLAAGAIWWGLSIIALLWATARLEPARVGILLMAEVLVGAASASYFAGEALSPLEIAGGALVLCAGVLEVWPTGRQPS